MAASTSIVMVLIRASRPSFRNANEKAAFVIHASFMASGYLLHSTGPPAFADDVFSSTSTENEVGIDHWNETDDDNYAFVYSNPNISPNKVLVKCLALNGKLLVDALREGDPDPLHLEFEVADYVTDSNGNYDSMFKDFGKLVMIVDDDIVAKLNGSSNEDTSSTEATCESGVGPVQPDPDFILPDWDDSFHHPPLFFPSFDPYGPLGFPGFEPNPFTRDPRRTGPGHPDLEPFGGRL